MKTSKKLPKLYEYTVCPFCWKVRALLQYKQIPFEGIEVHPINKKEIRFSENWKKVPIYIGTEGNQVNDSTPIMRYIDKTYSKKPVFENQPVAQTAESQWLEWADNTLVRALPPMLYDTFGHSLKTFDYITKIGKFNWFQKNYIKYCGAFVMKMVASKSAKQQNITDPSKHFQSCLSDWEKALETNQFFGREKPNGADLAIYGILKSIEQFDPFKVVKANHCVYKWYCRVETLLNKK